MSNYERSKSLVALNPQAERYAYELRLAIFGVTREVGRVQYVSAQIVHPLNSNLIHKHLHVVVVYNNKLDSEST